MDGLLIVDKPDGPTSHDVVSRIRRALRERRIGHTGTLDPAATGVLLLVVGRATRLAKFLSASDKSYDAVVRLGFSTDTADGEGERIGSVWQGPLPSRDAIDGALDGFRGTFLQQPPAFSAKKIEGKRSYKLARANARAAADALKPSPYALRALPDPRDLPDPHDLPDRPDPHDRPDLPVLPAPARVTAHRLEIVSIEADCVTLRVDCSAGFYVRSLAHDLGQRLGTGAHLAGLRRTRTGDFTVDQAVSLETAERDPQHAIDAMIPLADMLPGLASITLTAEGVLRAIHGRELDIQKGLGISESGWAIGDSGWVRDSGFVRLLDQSGQLVGIGEPTDAPGILHPSVVLV
jgi:tRNA pseudouridine55 synthase